MAIFPIPFHFMHSAQIYHKYFIRKILFLEPLKLSVFKYEDNVDDDDDEEDDKKIMKGKSEIVKCF